MSRHIILWIYGVISYNFIAMCVLRDLNEKDRTYKPAAGLAIHGYRSTRSTGLTNYVLLYYPAPTLSGWIPIPICYGDWMWTGSQKTENGIAYGTYTFTPTSQIPIENDCARQHRGGEEGGKNLNNYRTYTVGVAMKLKYLYLAVVVLYTQR